ncbi:uncharacterized protein [Apostichopus japonicus]|uniref:uncharacterized protein isoform X2 n=1 Tax=Stichopus japonicus TaxID=307972 RepID=UPI003AB3AE82
MTMFTYMQPRVQPKTKANRVWKKVKGTPEVSRYKEQADDKNRMEAEGATIRQEHKKVMVRHILTEIKKMCFLLQKLDYETMFIAIHTKQNLHSSGTTEGQKFLDKEGVMLMVLLKKQPVQHYVPACRSS